MSIRAHVWTVDKPTARGALARCEFGPGGFDCPPGFAFRMTTGAVRQVGCRLSAQIRGPPST